MARPTKLTPKLQAEICEQLKLCLWKETACAIVGINASTLRMWLAQARKDRQQAVTSRFTKLADAMDEVQAQNERTLLAVIQIAGQRDWKAATWILERLDRERYGYKGDQRVELTGKNGGPVAASVIVLPPQEPLQETEEEDPEDAT